MRTNNSRANEPEPLTDEVAGVLFADARRCALLRCLDGRASVEIDELARLVAAREAEGPPDAVPDETYRRTLLSLYHDHLPDLESVGAVDLDRSDGVSVAARRDLFEELAL